MVMVMVPVPFTEVEDRGRVGLVVEDDSLTFRHIESHVPERHPGRDIEFALPHLAHTQDLPSYLFSPKRFAEDFHFYKKKAVTVLT